MRRRALVPAAAALALMTLALPHTAPAHHSIARFDRCHLFTVAGEVTRVTWHNPHVEFAVQNSDGTVYNVLWLNLQQIKRDGLEVGVLKVGDRVEITGAKQPEDNLRMITLLTGIWRPRDGWRWSRPPQGC
jgi:hypothetical protein